MIDWQRANNGVLWSGFGRVYNGGIVCVCGGMVQGMEFGEEKGVSDCNVSGVDSIDGGGEMLARLRQPVALAALGR